MNLISAVLRWESRRVTRAMLGLVAVAILVPTAALGATSSSWPSGGHDALNVAIHQGWMGVATGQRCRSHGRAPT